MLYYIILYYTILYYTIHYNTALKIPEKRVEDAQLMNFGKWVKFGNTHPWVFFTFFKLYSWYQIALYENS